MAKIRPIILLAALLIAATAVHADTIYLKNGSVLKGKVASFADDQFTVMLNTGSDRNTSRATIFIGDVSRIEFDSAGGAIADSGPGPAPSTGPLRRQPEPKKREEKIESGPEDSAPPPEVTKPVVPPPSDPPVEPAPVRKPTGKITNVEVIGKLEWQSSRVIVKRGDRVKITATGTVTLDPGSGQTSGPEGIDQPDAKKLMSDRPTGALIAVIGADNDDFIFIGNSAEFTATRDGLLFLSVNEGTLSDNLGSYKALIEVQPAKAR